MTVRAGRDGVLCYTKWGLAEEICKGYNVNYDKPPTMLHLEDYYTGWLHPPWGTLMLLFSWNSDDRKMDRD